MNTCLICHRPVPDYEPQYCCDGRDCNCMAQPMNPCVCSVECDAALGDGIGRTFEERRILAEIPLWSGK